MPAPEDRPADERQRALEDFVGRTAEPLLKEVVDSAAAEVMAELERANVQFLLLKGPALKHFLYRPREQRRYLDVDLLVAPGARARAGAVLTGLGYENMTQRAGVDEFTGALHAESWHSQRRMPVDLHWRLAGCEAAPEDAWPHLFEGHQTVMVAGYSAPVLARAGLALHLATHAAQHGPDDVKALGDLNRGLERWPLADWHAAAHLAAAIDGTQAFAAGLRLLPQGADLARSLGLPPSAQLSWTIHNRHSRPRGTFHLETLGRARGPRDLVRVLRRSLMPSPDWIAREYHWATGSRWRVAAGYAGHILRAPAWAARAWSFRRQARRAARKPPDVT